MIVLDTNIVSELRNRKHSDLLLLWLDTLPAATTFLTTVSIAEIQYGIHLLPESARKTHLAETYRSIEEEFRGRILTFSLDAAHRYGLLSATRRKAGRPMEAKDAMIAAICLSHGATFATRNVKDFEGLDLRLVNPFEGT